MQVPHVGLPAEQTNESAAGAPAATRRGCPCPHPELMRYAAAPGSDTRSGRVPTRSRHGPHEPPHDMGECDGCGEGVPGSELVFGALGLAALAAFTLWLLGYSKPRDLHCPTCGKMTTNWADRLRWGCERCGGQRPPVEGKPESCEGKHLREDRRRNYGEDRNISIGRVEPGALIVVAHTERCGRIRLISARPASRKERRTYNGLVRPRWDCGRKV